MYLSILFRNISLKDFVSLFFIYTAAYTTPDNHRLSYIIITKNKAKIPERKTTRGYILR